MRRRSCVRGERSKGKNPKNANPDTPSAARGGRGGGVYLFEGTSLAGGIVIIGLVLWSCYCCESCPMYDHWNPRAKEKKAAAGHANYGATTAQPQIGEVVP